MEDLIPPQNEVLGGGGYIGFTSSVRLSALLRDACGVRNTDKCSIVVHVRLFTCMCNATHMHIYFYKIAIGDTNQCL